MSKFTKVAESQGLPKFIEKQFFQEQNPEQDMFAALRRSAAANKQVVDKEVMGHNAPQQIKRKDDWETVKTAQTYRQPQLRPTDSEMSNLQAEDLSGRAIRRVGYETDNGDVARSNRIAMHSGGGIEVNGIRLGSSDELISIGINGQSMFDDYEIENMGMLLAMRERQRDAMFQSEEKREIRATELRKQWESDRMKEVKPSRYASNRAPALIRTSTENVTDGAFGLPDYSRLDRHEADRMEMLDRKRAERLAIKRNGTEPEDRLEEWMNNIELQSPTFDNYKSDWLDGFTTKK